VTRPELLELMKRQVLCVEATVSGEGAPQAAVVGIVVTDAWEIFFATPTGSRKHQNLQRDAKIAFVVGWSEAFTVQYEGLADFPEGPELGRLMALYRTRFPDERERELWGSLTFVRVQPRWVRYSDFRTVPPATTEFVGAELR
jgi:Pyridoxamine 5'-phosphate oxidase